MAYSATVLDEFRLSYDQSNLDMWTHRFSTYGSYATYVKDSPNLIPEYNEMIAGRASSARTVSVPIFNRQTLSTSATRACTAKTTQATSAFVTPSWTTVETGFMMVRAEHAGNNMSYQNTFNHQGRSVERAFLLDADTDATANLVASLNAYIGAEDNPFTVTSNYLQVPLSYHDTFFNEFESILMADDISGEINVVGSPRLKAIVSEMSNQGVANSTNLGFQYGSQSFAYSNQVTISTAYHSTAYGMPVGSLAYLQWVDIDARQGHESGDGKKWYVQELPIFGQQVGVLYSSTCADKSSLLSGLDATLAESYTFSFDRAFVNAADAIATPNAGVIYGIEFLKT